MDACSCEDALAERGRGSVYRRRTAGWAEPQATCWPHVSSPTQAKRHRQFPHRLHRTLGARAQPSPCLEAMARRVAGCAAHCRHGVGAGTALRARAGGCTRRPHATLLHGCQAMGGRGRHSRRSGQSARPCRRRPAGGGRPSRCQRLLLPPPIRLGLLPQRRLQQRPRRWRRRLLSRWRERTHMLAVLLLCQRLP